MEESEEIHALNRIKRKIREIKDWPKTGVTFRDVCPLFEDPKAFHDAIDLLRDRYSSYQFDVVAGVEARGFVIGAALAYSLGKGFLPLRKEGKLPGPNLSKAYQLEYGSSTLEVQNFCPRRGLRVVVVDDLLAKGGTLEAACFLIESCGGTVVEASVLVELSSLRGKEVLEVRGWKVFSLLKYDEA
ncbi:adenine phosphoribosyltransferase [Galdieria sulphuraria]|uniref:adenine phosphoribosyltransferase n=1 Tax=Galdieria sulphuraria TaxID=130081 RepID=M2X0D9_GALSU|nr:adenine phosphoribosyltransferase [Galdieria sulphuraria]EME29795.1 adenine phosphoribosyltransferase [Galdieria sulphuraria]|eukprot:XP_005706315.1 adenine phosphoribosyltransferase [Galdieria sulphuraria]